MMSGVHATGTIEMEYEGADGVSPEAYWRNYTHAYPNLFRPKNEEIDSGIISKKHSHDNSEEANKSLDPRPDRKDTLLSLPAHIMFSDDFLREETVLPYLRLFLFSYTFAYQDELCVLIMRIRIENAVEFYSKASLLPQTINDLLDLIYGEVYMPKRQTIILVPGLSMLLQSLPPEELSLLSTLLYRFLYSLHPSEELTTFMKRVFPSKIRSLSLKQLFLEGQDADEPINFPAGQGQNRSPTNGSGTSTSPASASLLPAIRLVPQTAKSIEDFHAAVKKSEDEIKALSDYIFFKHYLTRKILFGKHKFYLNLNYQKKLYVVKIKLIEIPRKQESVTDSQITLDFYSNDDQERLIKLEYNLRSVEKILNCLQIPDPWMQTYTLQNAMSIHKTIMGRKVVLDKKLLFKEELTHKDSDEFIKSLMISKKIRKVVSEDPEESQIHLVASIENLGKCYATIEFITTFTDPVTNQAVTLVCIDISPVESRMKLFKVVINTADIRSIFKSSVEDILNDRAKLLQLFQRVVSSLLVVRKINFSLTMIPFTNVDPLSLRHTEDIKYYYYNSFDKYELLKKRGLTFKPMMRKVYKESWITHSKVIRSQGEYIIVTVEKHVKLRCHCLRIFMPKTGRTLTATLYYHDMLSLSHNFSYKVFAISPSEYDHILKMCNNSYMEFCQLAENHLKSQGYLSDQKRSAVEEYLHAYTDPVGATDNQMKKAALRGKLVDRIDNRCFAEMHVWDRILSDMVLHVSPQSKKFAVSIDNFAGATGECLYKNLFRSSQTMTYWLEIYLERTGEITDPFAPSPIIRFEDLDQFQLLIKLKLLEPEVSHNDKMNLRKVFELYAADQGMLIDKKHKESYLVTQARLAHIAYFVAERVSMNAERESVPVEVNGQERENMLSKKYFFEDKFERRMKTNSRINLEVRLEPEYKIFHPILLYTKVITLRPQQILSILYQEDLERIRFIIHNSESCEVFKRAYEMAFILKFIPHAKILIAHNLLTELGSVIYSTFKNSLLVELYLHHQDNNPQSLLEMSKE